MASSLLHRSQGQREHERASLPTSLSHQIRPPCISTKRFESARPRPVPSRCLARPRSAGTPRIRSRSSAAMPGPESATETVTSPFRCVALTSTDLGRRELHGVREQVEDDLPDPPLVSCDDVEAAVRMERDLNAVRRCLFANHRDAALEARPAARTARPGAPPGRPRPWTGRGRR